MATSTGHVVKARWGRTKRLLASLLAGDVAGRCLGLLFGDTIPFHGLRIDVDETIPPRNRAALFWGLYESAECRFIRAHLSPRLPVLECGAGIGAVSSVIAQVLEPGQALVCVEGNPRLVALLRRNLARHAGHLVVDVVEGAVGYGAETLDFLVLRDNLCSRGAGATDTGAVTRVRCVTPSTLVARPGWESGWQLVADVEGAEAALLARDEALWPACRRMLIELHDTVLDGTALRVDDLVALAGGRGFRAVARYGDVFVFER